MNKLTLSFAVVVLVVAGACRSDQQVCEDNVKASQAKYHECTPDAGGFGQLIELAFSAALGSCSAAPKCQLGDGGTGTFNSAQADKCTTEVKAASCTSSSTGTSTACSDVCK